MFPGLLNSAAAASTTHFSLHLLRNMWLPPMTAPSETARALLITGALLLALTLGALSGYGLSLLIRRRNSGEMTASLLCEIAGSFLSVRDRGDIVALAVRTIHSNTGYRCRMFGAGELDEPAKDGGKSVLFPVAGVTRQMGSLAVETGKKEIDKRQDLIIRTCAALLGGALELAEGLAESRRMKLFAERERLTSALLRSAAHDLRSPLSALSGASSLLYDRFDHLSAAQKKKLALDISEEMIWFSNLIENILSMTRVSEGSLLVNLHPEAVDDIVEDTLRHMSAVLSDRHVTVSLPSRVAVISADGRLLSHVLINLLDNAVRHTVKGGSIAVTVVTEGKDAVFSVTDDGEGFTQEVIRNVLSDNPVPGPATSGFGLPVCRELLSAHGSALRIESPERGGSRVSFSIPLEDNRLEEQFERIADRG